MNATEKLKYIELISDRLAGYSNDKIEYILNHYGYFIDEMKLSIIHDSGYTIAYETLKRFDSETLFKIANEFNVELNSIPISPSSIWKPNHFKAFISHSTKQKKLATELKNNLLNYGISSFVAHEDIHVTTEWRDEIIKGLSSMDVFIAILSDDFKASDWTDQEYGFALGKGCIFIPLIFDLHPYGFMSSTQGIHAAKSTLSEIGKSIAEILAYKATTRDLFIKKLFNLVLTSRIKKDFKNYLNSIAILKNQIGKENVINLRELILKESFFNKGEYIVAFNDFIKASFNELSFISKKEFLKVDFNPNDDSLPF